MEKKTLKQNLLQIKALVEECLVAFGKDGKTTSVKIKKSNAAVRRQTLKDHILDLKVGGVFKQPKAVKEVHARLQSSYPCELKRVDTELARLHKKRELRKVYKIIKGKKVKAYVW